jgi:predicted transcriptional regulator
LVLPLRALTGSRIRARRLDLGLRQVDLARAGGISASYLNLIEHNRRRIGGKLLVDLARALEIEVSALSQGADQALVEEIRTAAESAGEADAVESAEEFAGRFPAWARVLTEQSRRIAELEHAVETLSDRLAHDPFLSESLHDVLTTATAIRATSAILAEESDVDPAWQARFHRNLHEDSRRLAEASRALASYLDAGADASRAVLSPQEELHSWLEGQGFRLAWIEEGADASTDGEEIARSPQLVSAAAQTLARAHAERYRADAALMPEPAVRAILADAGPDPATIAQAFGADLPSAFRRIAALSGVAGLPSVGLAVCDGSGTLVFRKSAEGFPLPLFGAACPIWPLYEVLARPAVPLRRPIMLAGRAPRRFMSYSFAETWAPGGFDAPPLVRAYMLIVPQADAPGDPSIAVGTSCRICPLTDCAARREPSVIGMAG